jgi:hypothetical protein
MPALRDGAAKVAPIGDRRIPGVAAAAAAPCAGVHAAAICNYG